MPSADLTRLMNNARVHLPGAIDVNIQLEMFNLFNDFFQDSMIWQEDINFAVLGTDPVTTVYTLVPAETASMNRLLYVVNSAGRPVSASMQVPGSLLLAQPAGASDTLTATVALTINDPTDSGGYPTFPAWILNKYGTGLLEGLLGRMMAQPAKPWTNEKRSLYYERKMIGTTSQAKYEALHRNVTNGQAWRFPQNFASRRH